MLLISLLLSSLLLWLIIAYCAFTQACVSFVIGINQIIDWQSCRSSTFDNGESFVFVRGYWSCSI